MGIMRALLGLVLGMSLVVTWTVACEPAATMRSEHRPPRDAGLADGAIGDGGDDDDEDGDASADAGGATAAKCDPSVSFTKDIVPALSKAGCASMACHGTRLGQEPRLETKDVDLTYTNLTAHKIGAKPYVKPASKDPSESAMHCHLHGQCGAKMPPAGGEIPKDLVADVDGWLACGAPKN